MKTTLSLSLLAVLVACGQAKDSDKPAGSTTPVVAVEATLDSVTAKPATLNDEVKVVTSETNTKENKPTHTKPHHGDEAKEPTKKFPDSIVGFGYDTVAHDVRELCLKGKLVLDPGNSASGLKFDRYESYEAYKNTVLELKAGSILNKWAGVDFEKKFFQEVSAESLHSNYTFASFTKLGTIRITSTELDTRPLNSLDFFNKCGNRYISSAVVGGSFVANVSLTFKDFDFKQKIERERLDFSKLSQILKTEASYTEADRNIASVEISYAQIGGGGVFVPHLSASDMLKCSIENSESLDKCLRTLEKLAGYATSETFVKSIQESPKAYHFTTSEYN